MIVPVLGASKSCDTENMSQPGCGVLPSTNSISSDGKPGPYPWIVDLYLMSNPNDSFCTGSLISDLQILTAAHCVWWKRELNIDIGVIVGNQNVKKSNLHQVYKIEIYDDYCLGKGCHGSEVDAFKESPNIAVLTLETAVLLTSSVRPICLPSLSDTSNTYEGETGTAAGWGLTEDGVDMLQTVEVPIMANSECKKSIRLPWVKRYISSSL